MKLKLVRFLLWLTVQLGRLPLPLLRRVGWALGWLLYLLLAKRRRVVHINLTLCFPHWSAQQRLRTARRVFVLFAQSWLDRGWMWHGDEALLRQRIRLTGAVDELAGEAPTLIFVPHFMGMEAVWTGLTQQTPRHYTTVYAAQNDPVVDAWILRGRRRFHNGRPFDRKDSFKPVLVALRAGEPLCLLPDMNYEPLDSFFVPFYGVQAATLPSLSRVAKMGRAKVIAMVSRLTPEGYEVQVYPRWTDFPSDDVPADTARMNQELQRYIDQDPAQYYWVHKRFKDRPAGQTPPY